ncbi:MAG: tRNA-binding protein [Psychroflexus sp.]
MKTDLTWKDFQKVDMRVGTIISAEIFEEAKQPAYKMLVDLGEFGIKKTSAQITELYKPDDLIGKQTVVVINFPKKQIANMMSECLVLGAVGEQKQITIIQPESKVKNGTKIG